MTLRSPPVVEDFASDENAASSPVVPTVPHRARPEIEAAKVSPWLHFVAGGAGGMAGALFTCPLDVVKTRLQGNFYERSVRSGNAGLFRGTLGHFTDTVVIIRNLYRLEGPRSLFKGLGPNLVGVIPARSINFFTYGIGKDFISANFNNKEEATWVHLLAAANAGIVTSTATNPIWLVKTRLQLDKSTKSDKMREYKNSWDCITKVVKKEGIRGLYKGLSASYLGVVESSLQWVLYERMKGFILKRDKERMKHGESSKLDSFFKWCATSGSAGVAKLTASLITYPHEVIRTRLRQAPMESGVPKYTGLIQCFKLVLKEEGLLSMYGGLTPHLMRTVPNSIIMFGTWELIIKLCS